MNKWTDEMGFSLTWEEMIEEIKLSRLVNRNLHDLLLKYKIPVKDIANAEYQAKKILYEQQPPVEKPHIDIVEKIKRKPKKTAKKTTKKTRKI
jgi:hypothetical protein